MVSTTMRSSAGTVLPSIGRPSARPSTSGAAWDVAATAGITAGTAGYGSGKARHQGALQLGRAVQAFRATNADLPGSPPRSPRPV